jgi:hypothetical protein
MKMKSALLAMLVIGIIGAITITPIHASFTPVTYGRTDKPSYGPGDSGILYVTIRNQGTQAFTVKNISITYPWFAFVTDHWDGNTTTNGINQAVAENQNYNTQFSFTVPTDGRVTTTLFGGEAGVKVGTDIAGGTYQPTVNVPIGYSFPTYQPLSLSSSVLPIIEIVLLGIAVAMLALVYMGIGKLSKK